MTKRYVNDIATLEQGFGTTHVGDQVARMVLEAEPPFTVGVTGKWGAGKTSVLRRAFVTLGGKPLEQAVPLSDDGLSEASEDNWLKWSWKERTDELGWTGDTGAAVALREAAKQSLVVWYSPWQHQAAENPLVPLLFEIQAQYSVWMKAKIKANELNRRGGLAGLALLERVADAAIGLSIGKPAKVVEGTSKAVREAWREAAPESPKLGDGQRFHLLFEDAVNTLLDGLVDNPSKGGAPSNQAGRLVIFVDDLDRCEESVLVELLEAIKLYLGTRRCVFVLGIDETAVATALKRHWAGRSEDSNREYLEKLFQAIVPVPVPRRTKVREFLKDQLDMHEFPAAKECSEMIAKILEPNPRKIKNFVNGACASWHLFRQACVGEVQKQAIFAKQFLLFQYLRTHHKSVWRLLERQPKSLQVLTLILGDRPNQDVQLEGMDWADQKLLMLYFRRAFAHVMKDRDTSEDEHHRIPLADAVTLFEERIDRKRSDDCFIEHYRLLIQPVQDQTRLMETFLYLPPEPEHG